MNKPAEPRIEGGTAEKKGGRGRERQRKGGRGSKRERDCVCVREREKVEETSRTRRRGSHCNGAPVRTDRLRIYRSPSMGERGGEGERERGREGEKERGSA